MMSIQLFIMLAMIVATALEPPLIGHFSKTVISSISGRFCQEDINECILSNPCYNGATCRNTEGSYICDCVHGYDGVRCANNVDECVPGMC